MLLKTEKYCHGLFDIEDVLLIKFDVSYHLIVQLKNIRSVQCNCTAEVVPRVWSVCAFLC